MGREGVEIAVLVYKLDDDPESMLLPTSTLTLVCVAGVGIPLHVARGSNGTKFTVRHLSILFVSIYELLYHIHSIYNVNQNSKYIPTSSISSSS